MVFAALALGFVPGSSSAQSAGGGSSGAVAKTKNPFQVNNTSNYWQYQQTSSMGPSIGWSRIITDFPQNGQQSGFGGGLNSGFGGGQSGQSSSSGGGQSPNNGGSDPASGVFLSASYNTLVGLPFKQQSSSNNGGLPPGFGGGGFGYGGNPYGGYGNNGGGFNQLNAKGFGNIGGNGGTGL